MTTNALLGYPDDARLLIVNADDLGMYPAINEAVGRAFREGIVHSTSLMMPCPGAPGAIDLLKSLPDLPFAVHLSVIRDIPDYVWGPLRPKVKCPRCWMTTVTSTPPPKWRRCWKRPHSMTWRPNFARRSRRCWPPVSSPLTSTGTAWATAGETTFST